MSSKYKVGEDAIPHFVTFFPMAIGIGWVDVFSRQQYKELFVESLKYCQDNKGMVLHAWAPIAIGVTNHAHLILSSNSNKIEHIVRDLKKYTSKQIIKAIQENNSESRKEWMLNIFGFAGKNNNNNKDFLPIAIGMETGLSPHRIKQCRKN
jgi:putative transposase